MKSIRHLVLLVAAFVCALAIGGAAAAQAASYYVNGGGGSDSNAGTEAKPFNTIKKADSVAKAGDVIYLKGTFGHTYLSTSSGNGTSWNAGGFVTYKVWGDSWVNWTGGYSGITFGANKKFIMIDGFYNGERRMRIYNNEKGFLLEGNANNIKITGCVFNPDGYTSCTGHFVTASQANHVWIYDNEINSTLGGQNISCVYVGHPSIMNASDYIYISDNAFNVRSPSYSGVDQQAIDCKMVPGATNIHIFRNTFVSSNNMGPGLIEVAGSINFYDNYVDLSKATGNGGYLFYFWYESGSNPSAYVNCYRNTIVGTQTGLLYPIGGISWSNMKARIYNNVFKDCKGVFSKFSGYVGEINFYHNTFYNCQLSGVSGDPSATMKFKNNLFTNWGTYALSDTSKMTSTWNGNVYAKSGASASSTAFQWNGSGVSFNTLKGSYGQESAGQFGVSASVDSSGLLTAALPVGVNVSSEMSSWPDYNMDFNSKVRSGTWDAGASQNGGGTTVTLQPPTNLRVVQ